MKKIWCFMIVYTIFLCVPIQAKNEGVSYRLYCDSKTQNTMDVKASLITLLEELLDSLEEDSYGNMIVSNIPYLEKELDADVSYRNGKLYVKMGNAKGTLLKGTYQKEQFCMKPVEPKSKIQEWFDF